MACDDYGQTNNNKKICTGFRLFVHSLWLSSKENAMIFMFVGERSAGAATFWLHVLSDWKNKIQLCCGNDMLQIGLQLLIGIQQAKHLFLFVPLNSLSLSLSLSISNTHTHKCTSSHVTMHIDKPILSTISWTFTAPADVKNVTFDCIKLSKWLIRFAHKCQGLFFPACFFSS